VATGNLAVFEDDIVRAPAAKRHMAVDLVGGARVEDKPQRVTPATVWAAS
jgi:hypothetical protein